MIRRMLAAAQLKSSLYEEVEADKSATLQAMLVVILAALASGIAVLLGLPTKEAGEGIGIVSVVLGVVVALVGWATLALVAYLVGTKLFPTPDTRADWGELARTLGFAQSAGVLRIFGLLPVIGLFIYLAASIWTLVATVIAIRQALDYTSTGRAVLVTIVSYIPTGLIMGILFA